MRNLSKFLSIFAVATGLAVLVPAVTFAASFWKADISTPLTQSSRSFNVQYTTLSTNATDAIKVDLYQNGAMIGTQTTTKQYGDSGAFAVTVPSEGVYSYYIVATNGSEMQTTPTKQVSVVAPPTVINTVSTTTPGSSDQSTATGSAFASGINGVSGSTNGTSTSSNGQTNASGNSSTNKSNQTLGDSKSSNNKDNKKQDDKAKNDKRNSIITWSIIGALVLAVLGYANRGRIARIFNRNSEE